MAMSRATAMTAALPGLLPPVLHLLVDVDRASQPASHETRDEQARGPGCRVRRSREAEPVAGDREGAV